MTEPPRDTPSSAPTVLRTIVDTRRTHLDDIRARIAHVDPGRLPASERSLYAALGGGTPTAQHNRFIMECKAASPSLGTIRADYRPGEMARVYSRYASAISVLCEPDRFGGDYDHLATVAASTHLPVLCKDFIIDVAQVHAARYFGADAILLMLSVLQDSEYRSLAAEAERLGLDIITEVTTPKEVRRAAALGARIFGINHRDLNDLSIDLERSARLAPLVPDDAVVVAESGIRNHRTVQRLASHAHAFLVGSQLSGREDIDAAARELVYGPVKVCGLRTPGAAQAARACGATWGGLIFDGASPRNVSRETAAAIIAAEPGLDFAAVTRATENLDGVVEGLGVRALQLHAPYQGSANAERELIEAARQTGVPEVWRAVSMTTPTWREYADIDVELADRLILDAGSGGSGRAFDWTLITPELAENSFLAGGLDPTNLVDALGYGCFGLDLNSGFEYPPEAVAWAGHKNPAALRRGFAAIRDATPHGEISLGPPENACPGNATRPTPTRGVSRETPTRKEHQ